ncbi:MAG: homoserine kinase [Rhodothermales bacterium]
MYSLNENAQGKAVTALLNSDDTVRVFGPASLSNLGPGFDTLGLCLEGIGDIVEARKSDLPGVEISFSDNAFGQGISLDPTKNTAGVAAAIVAGQLQYKGGISLEITKGFKPGSGIGSSAASAVAAAYAVNALLKGGLSKNDLIEAVLGGEAIASGARHGDNVLPALFGGLVLVSSEDPTQYRMISLPDDLWIIVALPEVQVLTKQARAMLPGMVSLKAAVHQASALAFMTDAFRAGDWQAVGKWMMRDKLAEPVRSTLVPCYDQIKKAALEAGAFGCALTGSGPAMFAISDNEQKAQSILRAMHEASTAVGIESSLYLSRVNRDGVSTTAGTATTGTAVTNNATPYPGKV